MVTQTWITGEPQMIRRVNRALILRLIRARGPISRTSLVRVTQLAPRTVFTIVEELIGRRLVTVGGTERTRVGRRPVLYEFNPSGYALVGAKLYAEDLQVVVTDLDARILGRASHRFRPGLGLQEGIELVCRTIDEALAAARPESGPLLGLGIAVPGLVDPEHGRVHEANSLGWEDTCLGEEIERRLKIPVWIESLAKAMAVAEYFFGSGLGISDMICINAGRGIGAGIISQNMLVRGPDNAAGEIGHIKVAQGGPICVCGKRGCLEALASTPALVERGLDLIDANKREDVRRQTASDPDRIVRILTDEAASGNQAAAALIEETGTNVGKAVAYLLHALNPATVVIGGAVAGFGEPFLRAVQQTVLRDTLNVPAARVRITLGMLGPDTAAIGAAAIVLLREGILSELTISSE